MNAAKNEKRASTPVAVRKKPTITYKSGYKYQLARDYSIKLDFDVSSPVLADHLVLDTDGTLTICAGYAWDGPSGPAFDTPTFMRASLVHDALYQLMRMGRLKPSCREYADDLMRAICLEDGMWKPRAKWCHWAVRRYAGPAADPANAKRVQVAP